MVHGEAEGYGLVLSDRWAMQSVTKHLLNIWKQEVTGADVPTLKAVPFKWCTRVNSIVLKKHLGRKHRQPVYNSHFGM